MSHHEAEDQDLRQLDRRMINGSVTSDGLGTQQRRHPNNGEKRHGKLVLTVEVEQVKDFAVSEEMRYELVHAVKSRQSKLIVLDLRNNPGGVLRASVDVADQLLEEGLIVYTEGRSQRAGLEYKATPGDDTNGMPIIVLIGGTSS